MVQERYDIMEDDAEFVGDALHVPVFVDKFEEESVGSSRGEDYYEEVDMGSETITIECPVTHVYKDSNPDEGYTDADAVEFITSASWDSISIVDVETVELRKDGELFIASTDSIELDQYKY